MTAPASAARLTPAGVPRTLERQVLDALPVTIYAVDLEGRITLVNGSWSRFARANGAPQLADGDAGIGTSIWTAISDLASRAQIEHAMTTLREGRAQTLSWEFPCSSPDEERIFLMQVSPVRDGSTVTGYVFSTVDITPSHRAREVLIDTGVALARTISVERVLLEIAQHLRVAMASDAVAIALADADDPAALALGHQIGFDGDAAALVARLRDTWRDALDANSTVVRESADGMEVTAPMRSGGTPIGAITLSTAAVDAPHRIAEMQRVLGAVAAQTAAAIERARLVRRVEHKRRLEAIGEVAAGVAHELRNPLFGISSAAQLLRFRVTEDPVVEKNVGRILREVERLNTMVTSLLEYGRPTPVRLAPGDPDAVWDDVLELQRGRLESKALGLVRTRADRPCSCAVDTAQLAQVFTNLLVNAVEAAPEGTDLSLTTAVLPTGAWRSRLANGGPVVPPDVLARVFELFYSTRTGGTGIGLALCQRIVEEHGGTIALESAFETGTVATVTLPTLAHGAGASRTA